MDEKKRNTYIAIAVVVVLVALLIIPSKNEVGHMSSGHYFNVGIVESVNQTSSTVTVRITEPTDAGYGLVLSGKTGDLYVGQAVNVAYTYSSGLFENTSQNVEVTFYKNENLLLRLLRSTPLLNVILFGPTSELKIIDVLYDGSGIPDKPLTYYQAN